jgi:hypothetical protein
MDARVIQGGLRALWAGLELPGQARSQTEFGSNAELSLTRSNRDGRRTQLIAIGGHGPREGSRGYRQFQPRDRLAFPPGTITS